MENKSAIIASPVAIIPAAAAAPSEENQNYDYNPKFKEWLGLGHINGNPGQEKETEKHAY
jgi:hypothetical protein